MELHIYQKSEESGATMCKGKHARSRKRKEDKS